MKQSCLRYAAFMVLATLAVAPLTLRAETDVTDRYITSPGFDLGMGGWIAADMVTQTNTSFTLKNGAVYLEKWTGRGNYVGNGSVRQTIELPCGVYRLTAAAQNIQEGDATAMQSGARLVAGDESVAVGPAGDYSVLFIHATPSVEIGFVASGAHGNWICCDNFRLTLVDDSVCHLRSAVEQQLALADAYLDDFPSLEEAADAVRDDLDTQQCASEGLVDDLALFHRCLTTARTTASKGTPPRVVTDTRYARGSNVIFGRSTVSGVSSNNILEQGFCWSTEGEPTVADHRATAYITNNGRIYKISGLKPSTRYFIRAYAMTKDYAVGYGDVLKVYTIPKGRITYDYDNGADAEANTRIWNGLHVAVNAIWNNLTSIDGLNLSVHYGSGTPTADCSYGGWMRIGPSSSYQAAGTIMHEMNHAIGGGTTAIWYGPSCMRANSTTGNWLGERATNVIRFWDNDNTAVIKGDGTHFWPYGINGAHEDAGTEALYTGNGLINQALCEDGLQPVSGRFCLPAYSLEQDDDTRYYLTSEASSRGRGTAWLTDGASGKLAWMTMEADDAIDNDNAAWNITFDPTTQYYILRNVGTGRYLSHSSGIKTVERSSPSASEKFHVMRGRQDVVTGSGTNSFTSRGYWFIKGNGGSSPSTMSASASNNVSMTSFSLENNAQTQRWMVLTADEVERIEAASTGVRKGELEQMAARMKELSDTPHTTAADSTDGVFASMTGLLLQAAADKVDSDSTLSLISQAQEACWTFLADATPTDIDHPFDITSFVPGAAIDDALGWTVENATPTFNYGVCEFYETKFKFTQSMTLPGGTYKLKMQAFQRPGRADDVWERYVAGDTTTNVNLFARANFTRVNNIASGASSTHLGGAESSVGSPVRYFPNDMQSASLYFAAGLYDNEVVANLKVKASMLFGIRCTTTTASFYWTVFDNFRLYYYGAWSAEDVTALTAPREDHTEAARNVFDVTGRKVGVVEEDMPLTLQRGIYIINGKKTLVR